MECFAMTLFALLAFTAYLVAKASTTKVVRDPSSEECCIRCGVSLSAGRACVICGLDAGSREAIELRELETTARQIQNFLDRGVLAGDIGELIYVQIEARQTQLLDGDRGMAMMPVRRSTPSITPVPSQATETDRNTIRTNLNRMLHSWADVRPVLFIQRRQALAWYEQLGEEALDSLSPDALPALARLQEMHGDLDGALRTVRRLLMRQPVGFAFAALEAARWAGPGRREESLWFLDQAGQRSEFPQHRRTCKELQRQLLGDVLVQGPTVEPADVVDVIPVVTPALPPATESTPPPPPRPPRRSLREMLTAFMEERNILWGELTGGLLIVGCSIALVISLWRTLQEIPYFPFFIISGLTILLFAVGLYTLKRWKLESSSRGLLAIATLLVPLNFLVLAGLARAHAGGAAELITQVVALVVFAGLVRAAGHVLVQPALTPAPAASCLAFAVLAPSACELVVSRLLHITPPPPGWFIALACVVAVCQNLSVALVLRRLTRLDVLEARQAYAWFAFLGIATFSAAIALGFFLHWSDVRMATQRLSLPIALAAVPVLAGGALVQRVRQEAAPDATTLPSASTIGMGLMLCAIAALVTTVALAWPRPEMLIIVGSLCVAATTAVAVIYRQPIACAPLPACLVIAYLTAYHLHAGNLSVPEAELGFRILHFMLTPESGSALVVLVAVMNLAAEWLARTGRRPLAVCQAALSGIIALFSLWLVLQPGSEASRTALVCGIYGLGGLAVNLRWRQKLLSNAVALTLMGFWIYCWFWVSPDLFGYRAVLLALLSNATVLMILSLLAACLSGEKDIADAFVRPFRQASLIFSWIAVAPLVHEIDWDWLSPASGVTAWLATLWLVIAAIEGRAMMLAAAQIVFALAVLLLSAERLTLAPWFHRPHDLLDPRSLLYFGTGLGALSIIWETARWGMRWLVPWHVFASARTWTVDRLMLAELVLAAMMLMTWGIMPDVLRELSLDQPSAGMLALHRAVVHPQAWMLLATLGIAVSMAASHGSKAAPVGLVLLTLAAVAQVSGRCHAENAVTSSLCWSLGAGFVLYSLALCVRNPDRTRTSAVRRLVVGSSVVPVLLTTMATRLGLAGEEMPGAAIGRMGPVTALTTPLFLIAVGLVIQGVRLHAVAYIFGAGLIVQASVAGSYALAKILDAGSMSEQNWVTLFQIWSCVAALWALLWSPWWTARHAQWCSRAQICLASAGVTFVLARAVLLCLTMEPLVDAPVDTHAYPPAPAWLLQASSSLGWTSLFLAGLAAFWPRRRHWNQVSTHELVLLALGLLVVMAGSLERCLPQGWGYRFLMLGVFVYCLAGAVFIRPLVARRVQPIEPLATQGRDELILIALLGGLGTVLASCAVGQFQDRLGAAIALALGGCAAAVLASRCRRQDYALVAGFNVNQAVSLLVVYVYRNDYFVWFVPLIHANLITAALITLAWLRWRRHLSSDDPHAGNACQGDVFLTAQVFMLAFANVFLLASLFHRLLVFSTGPMSTVMSGIARGLDPTLSAQECALLATYALGQIGGIGGWTSLILCLWAVAWYTKELTPSRVVHVLGWGGLMLGTLAGCTATRWGPTSWLPQHVLTFTWSTVGVLILVAGWLGSRLTELGPMFWAPERRRRAAQLLGIYFPGSAVQRWAEIISALVVLLALRGIWNDPARPYACVAATIAVSVLLGALAIWSRRPLHAYLSGALVLLAGFIIWQAWLVDTIGVQAWMAWGPGVFDTFVFGQVLCLAVAAIIWSAVGMMCRRLAQPIDLWGRWMPLPNAAGWLAVQVLIVVLAGAAASDLTGLQVQVATRWAWLALAATIIALFLQLYETQAHLWSLPYTQLRITGMLGLVLGLHAAGLPPLRWAWMAGIGLASLLGLTSVVEGLIQRQAWRLTARWTPPSTIDRRASVVLQAVLIGVVVALSAWMSCTFALWTERAAGPIAVLLIMPAAWLISCSHRHHEGARQVVLLLLGVMLTMAGWTMLSPTAALPALERTVVLFVVSAMLGVVYHGIRTGDSAWVSPARRLSLPLAGCSCMVLLALLGQELIAYEAGRVAPLSLPLVLISTTGLLTLAGGGVGLALIAVDDYSFRQRTALVYAAQAVLFLTVIHLRLTVPHWFPFFLGRRWTFVVLGLSLLAFLLGEYLRRRHIKALAGPLQRVSVLLPLLPILVYQARLLESWLHTTLDVPGLTVLRSMLDGLPAGHGVYSLHWFLPGLFYLVVAALRGPFWFALLAGAAWNVGGSILLASEPSLGFSLHPQLWVVPWCLLVLVGEQVYRYELGQRLAILVRHVALWLLFLSATADLFITGLGNSVLLPVVLAVFSIVAVMSGILLRLRGFLSCGLFFLLVDVFGQIWHAAVHRQQTWVWWASGIVLGLAILVLFALFEKRRNDLLLILDDMQQWG